MDLDVWDFGGQLEYRATQRFYLTDRSLFLLVWNSRARAADGKVTAWLDAITARAPGAPVLLVATHGDENSPATLPHDLPDRYPGIAAVCTVDSRTGLGITELRDAIARHAATLPLMGARWPATWDAAARALSELPGLTVTTHRAFRRLAQAGVPDPAAQRGDRPDAARSRPDRLLRGHPRPRHEDHPEARVARRPHHPGDRQPAGRRRRRGAVPRGARPPVGGHGRRRGRPRPARPPDPHDGGLRPGVPCRRRRRQRGRRANRRPPARRPPPDVSRLWDEARARPGAREIAVIYKLASRQAGIPTWFIAREHRYTTQLHWRHGALLHDRDPAPPPGRY